MVTNIKISDAKLQYDINKRKNIRNKLYNCVHKNKLYFEYVDLTKM